MSIVNVSCVSDRYYAIESACIYLLFAAVFVLMRSRDGPYLTTGPTCRVSTGISGKKAID